MTGKATGRKRRRPDRDLNHVIREVLRDVIVEYEWTQDEAAKNLGLSLSTVQGVLSTDPHQQRNLSLRALSLICERLGESPVELLQRHPLYSPRLKGRIIDPSHGIYLRFRKLGTAEDIRRWTAVLEIFRESRTLGPLLSALEGAATGLRRVQRRTTQRRKTRTARR
jgi:transcriptional regulator with XRE-family HTH domain